MCFFSQYLTIWRPPFCKPGHVTKIEKNTNLQDLVYFLYLKTVKSRLQCIKGMHIISFSFSAIMVTLGCMGLEHELSKVVHHAPPRF